MTLQKLLRAFVRLRFTKTTQAERLSNSRREWKHGPDNPTKAKYMPIKLLSATRFGLGLTIDILDKIRMGGLKRS